MTTPNFTQDVPQWIESASWQCITALLMLKNQSLTDDDVRGLHAAFHGFIAKHAPQPEAKEVAVLESMLANEEQACMEALEERDTAIGFCDLFAATILGEDINWSCHETKWQEALDMMSEFVTAADHDAAIAELRAEVERVKQWELDAWRTVGNLEDAAEGRPIEIEDGKSPHPTVNVIAELREKLADEERRGDLHADLNKRVAEAIGNPFTGPGSSWHDLPEKVAALRTRAEAAEAEVARLHKIIGDCEMVAFDNSKPPQLWSWIGDWEGGAAEPLQRIKNAKDAVKEIASLTAQLAAANERVAEFEARLDAVRKMISAGQ